MNTSSHFSSCVAEYDPNALPVSAAQEIVRQWALPRCRTEVEHVRLFDALDRVLAEDVVDGDRVGAVRTSGRRRIAEDHCSARLG